MIHHERMLYPSNIETGLIKEKHLYPNGSLLLFTANCPRETKTELTTLVQTNGVEWLLSSNNKKHSSLAHRTIYFPQSVYSNVEMPVFLRKNPKKKVKDESLKIEYFTESVIHEMRTSYLLEQILLTQNKELPQEILYENRCFKLKYCSQNPWGALINLEDSSSRFTFFKPEQGCSIRDHVELMEG